MGDSRKEEALSDEMKENMSFRDSNPAPCTPSNNASTRINGVESNVSANGIQRSASFAFRAPQEAFRMEDFESDKMLGVGSYSRV